MGSPIGKKMMERTMPTFEHHKMPFSDSIKNHIPKE
jgi:hypothetical protein